MANLKVKLEGKKIAEKVMDQRDTALLPYKKNNKRFGRTRRTP